MHKRSINDYLPKPPEETVMVQGRIPSDLHEKATKARKEDHLSWQDIIAAGIAMYVDSRQSKK